MSWFYCFTLLMPYHGYGKNGYCIQLNTTQVWSGLYFFRIAVVVLNIVDFRVCKQEQTLFVKIKMRFLSTGKNQDQNFRRTEWLGLLVEC